MRIGYGREVAGARMGFSNATKASWNHFMIFTPIATNLRADLFFTRVSQYYSNSTLVQYYGTKVEIRYVPNVDHMIAAELEEKSG